MVFRRRVAGFDGDVILLTRRQRGGFLVSVTTILVHGRGGQFQDPVSLETAWEDAFLRGLAAARVAELPPRENILFPYYGDLYESYGPALRQEVTVEEKRARLEFEREVASQIRRKLLRRKKRLLPRRDAPVASRLYDPLLEYLDRVPGFSWGFVRLVFRDIHDYFSNKDGLRDRTMARVFEPIRNAGDGKVIIVAHSLGSIVTYDILNTHAEVRIDLYVTLGSPLGIDEAIHSRLLADRAGRRDVPVGVRAWVNFADPDDFVALDETLGDDFRKNDAPFVRDIRVTNPRGNGRSPHDSDSYLSQKLLGLEVRRLL